MTAIGGFLRRRRTMLASVLVALLLVLALVRVCADGGAMAGAYRTCECHGVEWLVYDRTPADGPRRTICVGFVRSQTCHRFRDGPAVVCPG